MLPNSNIIISDTNCLIVLSKIDELELLKELGKRIYLVRNYLKQQSIKLASKSRNFQSLINVGSCEP